MMTEMVKIKIGEIFSKSEICRLTEVSDMLSADL